MIEDSYFNDFPQDNGFPGFAGNGFFTLVASGIFIIMILMIGIIVYQSAVYFKDRRKPIIPTPATVVAKRTSASGHEHHYTRNYVTFQFMNGERLELEVPDRHFGLMVEGDQGILSFQGNLFVEFTKQ